MEKQWLHITLALMLYISTAGISVHSHFCNEVLKDTNFWMQPESCHSDKVHCINHQSKDQDDRSCCDDEVSFEKMDIDFLSMSVNILPDLDFMAIEVPSLDAKNDLIKEGKLGCKKYRPPPDDIPLFIRYQSFLC